MLGTFSEWLMCLWGAAAFVFVNMIRVVHRGTTAALTQPNSDRFSLNGRRAAAHLLRHNDDDDDGRYEDGVWGQAGEKHICRVVFGRRGGRDGRLFECCHYVKASPGCPCTLTPVAKSRRPRPSGRSVCLLLLKGSGSGIQARVRGLATCPKSKL